jgi:HK97 family phage major capsid protein
MNKRELMQKRASLIDSAKAIAEGPQTDETRAAFDEIMKQAEALKGDIARVEKLEAEQAELAQPEGAPAAKPETREVNGAPAVNKTKPGDSESRALAHYIRTGDLSRELRASNDTDMNIGTPADGGYAVPTGHYQGIIAKRNEGMLAPRLGVLRIPGQGTTVNVTTDNGTANEFVSTNEGSAFDRDAAALGRVQMTLVKYTKKVQLSVELLRDEDANLLNFLNDYVGRAMAITHNKLLFTEVLANGTSVTLGAAAAASAGDIPKVVYSLKSEYADAAKWVFPRANEGAYRALTGNNWQFVATPPGSVAGSTLWGFPVFNSEQAIAAIGAGNKSSVFGDFGYVGLRESSGFQILRDPYSAAGTGQVNLFYYFDAVYKVLQAEAVLYGKHPTA